MLVRRDCIGNQLFSEQFFMYGEDMELCHRMRQMGKRVVYTPTISIIHIQGASMNKQRGEILLSSLKGLRMFYALTRGTTWIWLFDLLTIVGFLVRSVLYSFLGIFSRSRRDKSIAKAIEPQLCKSGYEDHADQGLMFYIYIRMRHGR